MKNKIIIICAFAILFRLECFSQASATAGASAMIIDVDGLVRKAGYDPSQLSFANKMRIVDSISFVEDLKRVKKQMATRSYVNNYDVVTGQPLYAMVPPITKEQKNYGEVYGNIDPSILGDVKKMFYHRKKTTQKKESHVYLHPSKNGINWHH